MSVKRLVPLHAVALDTDPSGARIGDIYYNTTDEELRYFDGTDWNPVFQYSHIVGNAGQPDFNFVTAKGAWCFYLLFFKSNQRRQKESCRDLRAHHAAGRRRSQDAQCSAEPID